MKKEHIHLWLLAGIFWTIVIASFAWQEGVDKYDMVIVHADMVAQAQFKNDLLQRQWAASHGGVYVPIDVNTPPNPYLKNIPERDIETPSGRKLTLVNPAYMMRQVKEMADDGTGVRGHITSLNPLRPANKADPWETAALHAFEQGKTFVQEVSEIDHVQYLRSMHPMFVEQKCLKCHAIQGYKLGDIRGGISVSVPLSPYIKVFHTLLQKQLVYQAGLWLLGLVGLFLFRAKTQRQFLKTARALEDSLRIGQELKNSQERFQSLSDASFGGVIIHDQGLILDCNQGLVEMTGFPLDELVGMNGLDLIEPDSLPLVLEHIKRGYTERYEVEGVRKDGSVYPLSIKGKNVQYRGREVRVIEFRDISARKKAEEAVRKNVARQGAMLENIVDVIAIIDQAGINRFLSANVERWFGWRPDQLVGHAILDNIHPDDLPQIGSVFAKLVREKNSKHAVECRYRCGNGQYKWIELSGVNRLHDPDIDGILLSYHDITERLVHEKEQYKLEKLESIGVLAGGLAHDFNNLLAGVYGNVSLAKMNLQPEHPAHRYIGAIEKSVDSAKLLTNQFLTFAKGGDPIKKNLDVVRLIREVVHFNLSGSKVKPVIETAENIWLANVDQGQIEQVFANLAVNAKQAMSGGGELLVQFENVCLSENESAHLAEGRYVRVRVADNGCGIAPEILGRIFDPYFTTKETGSGLGLATIHSIVQRHGGHIEVSSCQGEGTTFILYLPAVSTQGPVVSARKNSEIMSLTGRVLIMDDDEVVCETLTAMLKSLGFRVEASRNGREAVAYFQRAQDAGEPFELVMLDLTIRGEEGGKETAQKILQLDSTAKLIVSSGYAGDAVMANYHEYGFRGVVRKPYLLQDLSSELYRVLREG